jgi:hypothetical protein
MKLLFFIITVPLLAQWKLIPAFPTSRAFEIQDISNTPWCSGPGIATSSRSIISGNNPGLYNWCAGKWTTIVSNQPVSSFVVTKAGAIVYSQLVPTAQGLTGASMLPITLLTAPGATPRVSTYQADVRRLAINRTTGTMYALQVDGSVFTSSDGATWAASSPQTHFVHANAIGGLAVGPDGGVTVCDEVEPCEKLLNGAWTNIGVGNNSNAVFFTPDGSAWDCDSNNNPRKWDGAQTWNPVQISSSFAFRCHFGLNVGTSTYIVGRDLSDAGTPGPHVYVSSNNGQTWVAFETGLTVTPGGEGQSLGIDCSGTAYMGTDEGAIAGAGIFSQAGIGPNTCGSPPPPPTGGSVLSISFPWLTDLPSTPQEAIQWCEAGRMPGTALYIENGEWITAPVWTLEADGSSLERNGPCLLPLASR